MCQIIYLSGYDKNVVCLLKKYDSKWVEKKTEMYLKNICPYPYFSKG